MFILSYILKLILLRQLTALDCKYGEWSHFGSCTCNQGTCGTCQKKRVKNVVQKCAHGGDCSCKKVVEAVDCSRPCRKMKYRLTYWLIH